MIPSREALNAVVERSPTCVAAHDREGWLGWTLTFRFRLPGAAPGEGLGLLTFDPASRKIEHARFFPA